MYLGSGGRGEKDAETNKKPRLTKGKTKKKNKVYIVCAFRRRCVYDCVMVCRKRCDARDAEDFEVEDVCVCVCVRSVKNGRL